jgi:hypothetical protein
MAKQDRTGIREDATMTFDVTSRRTRRASRLTMRVALTAALGTVLVVGGAPAAIAAAATPSCPVQSVSTPFLPWGDAKSYFLMPGGSFEAGAPGWALTGGAGVGSGNESSYITGHEDSHRLMLPAGAQAVSPSVCVDGGNTMRLFVRNSGPASSALHVTTYAKNPATDLEFSHTFTVTGSAVWGAPISLFMPNLMGVEDLTMVFTTSGPDTWSIDDVYVDPFKSR